MNAPSSSGRYRSEAFLVEAVRTPVGKRGGGLSSMHPVDLASHVLRQLIRRAKLEPGAVDDVILGCIDNIGPQSANIARTAWLAAGLPEHVAGVTVDRRCGSSQQAIHFAAATVMAGIADIIIAGGVQHMSAIPLGASYEAGRPYGFEDPLEGSAGWYARYHGPMFSQIEAADQIASRWGFSREELDEFAIRSHERACMAQERDIFLAETCEIGDVRHDEGPRRPDLERIRSLQPLLRDGRTTAASSSQLSDGAAALLITSERALEQFSLTPRARIHYMGVTGGDPRLMLTAPIQATATALERTGMKLEDLDIIEVNEAFSSVALAWENEFKPDARIMNPNGGAIALGHPVGATGARIMTSLLFELERTGGRYGLQTMCQGGGQANVTIVERL